MSTYIGKLAGEPGIPIRDVLLIARRKGGNQEAESFATRARPKVK